MYSSVECLFLILLLNRMNIFPRSRQEVSVLSGFHIVPTLLEPDLSSVQYNDSDFISFKEGFVKFGVSGTRKVI